MMQVARPGIKEYEPEFEFNYELAAHGQRSPAFPHNIAAGERIFYLHYSHPFGLITDGELILTDVGTAYDDHCAGISRVFPANGHFSERQAQIYRIAYSANQAIMEQVCPGVSFNETSRLCREVTFEGLKALGLLDDFIDIKKYFWHNTTHHSGLDTHDAGGYEEPMSENMIFTTDAGTYIRERSIGLRTGDNVLVIANGYQNLSTLIPATIEEIENIVAR